MQELAFSLLKMKTVSKKVVRIWFMNLVGFLNFESEEGGGEKKLLNLQ